MAVRAEVALYRGAASSGGCEDGLHRDPTPTQHKSNQMNREMHCAVRQIDRTKTESLFAHEWRILCVLIELLDPHTQTTVTVQLCCALNFDDKCSTVQHGSSEGQVSRYEYLYTLLDFVSFIFLLA